MKAIWFRLKFLFLLLCLIPLVTACLFFPDTTHTTVVEGHNQIVSVTAPVSALDRGATIAVEPTPVHNTSGTVTPIGNPIQIKLSSGDLHGQATITFTYPQHLPKGITPNDLMVTEYSPVVNVWLPVPSTPKVECEKTSHRLLTNVIDSLSPGVDTVCVQDTKEQDVVELKLANTHVYPVWVSLPKGVEFEPHAQKIEYDHFEELMMQFV